MTNEIKIKIDRETLIDCIDDFLDDHVKPVNPVLTWNESTGVFSWESSLNEIRFDDGQRAIVDYNDFGTLFNGPKNMTADEYVACTTNEWIIENLLQLDR